MENKHQAMKEICLGVLSYVAVSILLIVATREAWKNGDKFISVLTGFVAILTIWNAVENYKKYRKKNLSL